MTGFPPVIAPAGTLDGLAVIANPARTPPKATPRRKQPGLFRACAASGAGRRAAWGRTSRATRHAVHSAGPTRCHGPGGTVVGGTECLPTLGGLIALVVQLLHRG